MENCKLFYVGSTVGSNIFSSSDPLKKKKKKPDCRSFTDYQLQIRFAQFVYTRQVILLICLVHRRLRPSRLWPRRSRFIAYSQRRMMWSNNLKKAFRMEIPLFLANISLQRTAVSKEYYGLIARRLPRST